MSRITVTGRAGADAELRFTPNGKTVAEIRLAETHRRRDDAGVWSDDGTTWYRVTLWGQRAEHVADVIRKGALLVVTGDLRVREFEAKDGTRGRSVEIVADEIGIVPIAGAGGARPRHGGQAAPAEDPWANGGAGW